MHVVMAIMAAILYASEEMSLSNMNQAANYAADLYNAVEDRIINADDLPEDEGEVRSDAD